MAKKPNKQEVATTQSKEIVSDGLVDELRDLIQETRSGVAQAVNSALVQLYWRIGTRVRTEILKNERADYGQQICVTLSHEFKNEFGNGFSRSNIELLQLDQSGIHVASYLTELPPIEVLRSKLHESVQRAQALLDRRGDPESDSS